jgi:hypothetical protein
MKKQLRQLSKGMGVNLDSQMKRKKKEILGRIEEMDDKAEAHGLCEEDWKWRYKLEGDLEEVLEYEEQIWQQRCSEQRVLRGTQIQDFSME